MFVLPVNGESVVKTDDAYNPERRVGGYPPPLVGLVDGIFGGRFFPARFLIHT
jgi:hypothetical protein